MPQLPDSALRELPLIAMSLETARYTGAAGVTVMFYDWFLTLPAEIKHVWMAGRWTVPSVFFLVNRYLPFPILILSSYHTALLHQNDFSDQLCQGIVMSGIIAWSIAQATATWLLSLRVLTLYSGKRIVTWSIYFMYFATHGIAAVFTGISFSQQLPTIAYWTPANVCGTIAMVPPAGPGYMMPLILEVYIFALQVVHHYTRNRVRRQHDIATFGLVKTLYMDGYVYFIACMVLRVVSLFAWQGGSRELLYLTNQFEFGLTVPFAARFHLHLREVAQKSGTTFASTDQGAGLSGANIRLTSRTLNARTSLRPPAGPPRLSVAQGVLSGTELSPKADGPELAGGYKETTIPRTTFETAHEARRSSIQKASEWF